MNEKNNEKTKVRSLTEYTKFRTFVVNLNAGGNWDVNDKKIKNKKIKETSVECSGSHL